MVEEDSGIIKTRHEYFMNKYLIIVCTNDKYELPMLVFNNIEEMSKHFNEDYELTYNKVYKSFRFRGSSGDYEHSYKGKIRFVQVVEDKPKRMTKSKLIDLLKGKTDYSLSQLWSYSLEKLKELLEELE